MIKSQMHWCTTDGRLQSKPGVTDPVCIAIGCSGSTEHNKYIIRIVSAPSCTDTKCVACIYKPRPHCSPQGNLMIRNAGKLGPVQKNTFLHTVLHLINFLCQSTANHRC